MRGTECASVQGAAACDLLHEAAARAKALLGASLFSIKAPASQNAGLRGQTHRCLVACIRMSCRSIQGGAVAHARHASTNESAAINRAWRMGKPKASSAAFEAMQFACMCKDAGSSCCLLLIQTCSCTCIAGTDTNTTHTCNNSQSMGHTVQNASAESAQRLPGGARARRAARTTLPQERNFVQKQ